MTLDPERSSKSMSTPVPPPVLFVGEDSETDFDSRGVVPVETFLLVLVAVFLFLRRWMRSARGAENLPISRRWSFFGRVLAGQGRYSDEAATRFASYGFLLRDWEARGAKGKSPISVAYAPPVHETNDTVWRLVSSGQYRLAVGVARAYTARALLLEGLPSEVESVLAECLALHWINAAEAYHNLGRDKIALRVLELAERSFARSALAHAGGRCMKAWSLVHLGRFDEAQATLDEVEEPSVLGDYEAEYWFTRAKLALARTELEEARRLLDAAEKVVRRPSSERNLVFLRARLALAESEKFEAVELFRKGAAHPFRGQGGEDLLLYARLCEALELEGEAKLAKRWASERDPERVATLQGRRLLRLPLRVRPTTIFERRVS